MKLVRAALVATGLAACSGGGGGRGDAGGDAAASIDAGTDAPAGIVDVTRLMDSCRGLPAACTAANGPDCGTCQYRIRFDPGACSPAAPCDDLLLHWAAMGCEGDRMADLLDGAVAGRGGWVTACVQPLYPGELLPTTLGAPERDAAVMAELLDALRRGGETGAWTGKRLLMTGCSAGASRYPVVAARYTEDGAWLGSERTGVCMSDGVVSIGYQDRFIGEVIGTGGQSCAGRHQRVARAYTVAAPGDGHACADSPQGQCACDPAHASRPYPGDCGGGDCVAFDSIVVDGAGGLALASGVRTDAFAARDWRLVSEGAGFADSGQRCDRDIVPEAPFAALCSALDADPERACSFVRFPDTPHCARYMQELGSVCVDWFAGR